MQRKLRTWYNKWKCWFLFKHRMEYIGKLPNGDHKYQCSFCFMCIGVKPFGQNKGAVETAMPAKPVTKEVIRNFIGQPK